LPFSALALGEAHFDNPDGLCDFIRYVSKHLVGALQAGVS
jgi:hypothetical protein